MAWSLRAAAAKRKETSREPNKSIGETVVAPEMLKRRASKRFVLAETGEPVAWDTTMDNEAAPAAGQQGAGFRRDSIVDGVPPPPTLLLTSPTMTTALSSSVPSSDTQSSSTSAPADVANNSGSQITPSGVDGSRLAVSGTGTSLIHGGSLK